MPSMLLRRSFEKVPKWHSGEASEFRGRLGWSCGVALLPASSSTFEVFSRILRGVFEHASKKLEGLSNDSRRSIEKSSSDVKIIPQPKVLTRLQASCRVATTGV